MKAVDTAKKQSWQIARRLVKALDYIGMPIINTRRGVLPD